jgi:hypothetical protein
VKPALSWKASVLTVKDVPEGAYIGYGGMYRARSPCALPCSRPATRTAFPTGFRIAGVSSPPGVWCPSSGAVSMDVTTIDVTGCPQLRPGDAVTLLGSGRRCRHRCAADGTHGGNHLVRHPVRHQREGKARVRLRCVFRKTSLFCAAASRSKPIKFQARVSWY